MPMYAIIEYKTRQYVVEEGKTLKVDRTADADKEIVVDKVLLVNTDKESFIGNPYIEGAKVVLEPIKEVKDKKVVVFKKKRRKGYKKTIGHRQKYLEIRVKEIVYGAQKK